MAATALELAQRYWDARIEFHFAVSTADLDSCLERAVAAAEPTVFVSDAGDNLTAGAPGTSSFALDRLLALGIRDALLVSLLAPVAVEACAQAGISGTVELELGAPPLAVSARVVSLGHDPIAGATAVTKVGGVTVVITERREAFTTLAHFERAGVDPLAHRVVVIKLGYLFPELAAVAPLALLATTPGVTDLDPTRLPYRRIRRPIHPLDELVTWQPNLSLAATPSPLRGSR
jgi:microcystin degradation protein MlrC